MSDATRIVADADVLAADLLVGGAAREAMDIVRRHDWLTLVVTGELLSDCESVVADLAEPSLATDHRMLLAEVADVVEQTPGDHPALAAAHEGEAAHILSLDDKLTSARAGMELQPHLSVSVRTPSAFVTVFDPEPLYEERFEEPYSGPDVERD